MIKKELEAQLVMANGRLVLLDTTVHMLIAEIGALLLIVEEVSAGSPRDTVIGETARESFFRYRVQELERRILKIGDTDPQRAEEMQKIVERWRKLPGGEDKF